MYACGSKDLQAYKTKYYVVTIASSRLSTLTFIVGQSANSFEVCPATKTLVPRSGASMQGLPLGLQLTPWQVVCPEAQAP